ncbi:MAG TPA: hypothetical protein VIA63_05105 [Candidatus Limnocylindria bacterium]
MDELNIFDSAIIVAAIAGGITGGLVAAIITLGVLRGQRRIGGTSIGAPQPSSEWRVPSGPLARHLAHTESPEAARRDERARAE